MIIERIQGTDGIRSTVRLAEDCSGSDPISVFLDEAILTEEFFELYTYAYCQELLESNFASANDLAVIGWDPRDISGIFNRAAVRGIRKAGLTAVVVDILPTPAISLYQLHVGAACAFVLTASHNPADQNGIKIFIGFSNLKLFPEDDKRLTQRCLSLNFEKIRLAPLIGELRNDHEYARKLFSKFMGDHQNHWLNDDTLVGTKIIVDAANGAFSFLIKELLNYDLGDFIFTNCDPSQGINVRSGVADLEGVSTIYADEIENGIFSGYQTLHQMLLRGRKLKEKLLNNSCQVLGFVFDGDGDRCFLLSYDPFQDCILVVGGDTQAFFQAKFLCQNNSWNNVPIFVNTVESDLEAGRAVQKIGFETMQCAVGDKWILWQSFYYDCLTKFEYYLNKITDQEFRILLEEVRKKLDQMVQTAKFDTLSATMIVMSLETWVRENMGDELVKSASSNACQKTNNNFAVGSEESGHLITLAKLNYKDTHMPVFIGNGLKCALNSLAAIQILRPTNNANDFIKWLKTPFPKGFQKSLPIYYVDKSFLNEDSAIRAKLQELLLFSLNWKGFEIDIVKRQEEPEMLLLSLLDQGDTVATVFVRNSGTEDKLSLYIRSILDLAEPLEIFAENIYHYLLNLFKDKCNPMAQAEQLVLKCLEDGSKQTIDFNIKQIDRIFLDRLLHEMSSRQELIKQEDDTWSITKRGRVFLHHPLLEK